LPTLDIYKARPSAIRLSDVGHCAARPAQSVASGQSVASLWRPGPRVGVAVTATPPRQRARTLTKPSIHREPTDFAARFPWLLSGTTQRPPAAVPARTRTLDLMKNIFRGRHGRAARWAAGVTMAGFLAGGGLALATGSGSANAAGQGGASTAASTAQLNALLSASGTSASGTSASANAPGANARKVRALRRLRALGGMYGSFTFQTKSGDETLAFERGTIESVSRSNVVVRAADGTTMTWQLVADTVVRDHGKSSPSALSGGQLIFVGGPVVSGARDARLIVIRSGGTTSASSVS
jgi:hypothetical protein